MTMSVNMIDLEVLGEEALHIDTIETTETNTSRCEYCGYELRNFYYECPQCGLVIAKRLPRRETTPQRTLLREIESQNKNGVYKIYRLQDDRLFCDCLAYLFQRGVDEKGYCKHCREMETENVVTPVKPATKWQQVLLKKLGVGNLGNLSSEQAYFILNDLLVKMGVEYREFIQLLKETPEYELLPLYSFGVELEGLVRDKEALKAKLNEYGIRSYLTGYSHELRNKQWQLGDDGSVRRNITDEEAARYQSIEITSPKIFGNDGFKEIETVCKAWNEVGSMVNNSCGFHVHISAYNYTKEDLRRLLLVWAKIENIVFYLVSPSRRNNRFAKLLRKDSEFSSWVLSSEIARHDRYKAVNLNPYNLYNTVEFRIHQGTTNPEKVIFWVVFCLKLMEKVKAGLKWYHFSDEPTVEEVLDKLGINNKGLPILKRARAYFIERYTHFSREGMFDSPTFNQKHTDIQIFINSRGYSLINYILSPDSSLARNHFRSLAGQRLGPAWLLDFNLIAQSYNPVDQSFSIQIPGQARSYRVHVNGDFLTCNCRTYRERGTCTHAINVGKYLYYENILKKLDF